MQQLQPSDPPSVGGYPLLARLDAGGMGQVYLSRTIAGRPLALKTIRADLGHDPGFETRFAREIANSDRVRSPWSVTVVDYSQPGQHPQWLANEYVPAPSLSDWVTQHGPLPEPALLALAVELCEALRAIRQVALTHRDVKPGNILLARDRPRLIDFGIARAVDDSRQTQTGQVVGSPGYLAPEQVTHDQTTETSDVFSLAAVLAFAATGRNPFARPGEKVPVAVLLYRHVHEDPQLDGVPEALRPLLRAGLTRDPRERPDAEQLAERLRQAGGRTDQWPRVLPPALEADITTHEETMRNLLAAPAPPPTRRTVPDPRAPEPPTPGRAAPPAVPPDPTAPDLSSAATVLAPDHPAPPGSTRRGLSRRRMLFSVGGLAAAAAAGGTGWFVLGRDSDPPPARVRWRYRLPGGWGGTFSPAGTLSKDGQTLYVGTGQGLHAVSAAGKQRWEFHTGVPASTPALTSAGICFATLSESTMYLVKPSGAAGWEAPMDGRLTTPPLATRDYVWAGYVDADEEVWLESWGLDDPETGDFDELSSAGSDAPGTPMTVAGKVLYLSDGSKLRARSVESFGEEHWRLDLKEDLGLPVVSGDILFVSSDGEQRNLHGVTLEGELAFTRPGRGGGRDGVTVATRSIAFTVAGGALRATDAEGRSLWTFEPPDGVQLLANTATAAEDTVYVQGGDSLYAVGLDGEPRWQVTTGEVGKNRGLRPVARGRRVYVATARELVAVEVRPEEGQS